MRSRLRFTRPLAVILVAAGLAGTAHGAPRTFWAHFPAGPFPVGTPTTVPLSDNASVEVTVQTGGTRGVNGADLDTLGIAATGLDYAHLWELGIFNGGGFSSVPTTLTFANASVGTNHVRGLLMVGAVNGTSSPITVASSVPGRVPTWVTVGSAFALNASNDFPITWNPAVGTFATGAVSGNDSRCIVIDLGDLRTDGTVTVSLNQHLNDGIAYSFGEEVNDVLDAGPGTGAALAFAPPRPNPAAAAVTLAFSLPAASDVRVEAFDLGGRRVATLADGAYAAGTHTLRWDLVGGDGARVAPGLVLLRFATADGVRTRRLMVVR